MTRTELLERLWADAENEASHENLTVTGAQAIALALVADALQRIADSHEEATAR